MTLLCNMNKKKNNVFCPSQYKDFLNKEDTCVGKKQKKKQKLKKNEFIVPVYKDYGKLLNYDYKVNQLKTICKSYKLKVSGNKEQLVERIYSYLYLSYFSSIIQSRWKGCLNRHLNKLRGPAFMNRSKCVNESDFFTLQQLIEVPYNQFFSYKNKENFIYGFDITSLYNLIIKSNSEIKNPYDRTSIDDNVVETFKKVIYYSKVLGIQVNVTIKPIKNELSSSQIFDIEIMELFQEIDNLGNYTDAEWFRTLNRVKLIQYIRELYDIWNYRAQLTQDAKRDICPPSGNPFFGLDIQKVNTFTYEKLKKTIFMIMKQIVYRGINNDSRTLGAYYILSALTLVSLEAAQSMPWLYQSVIH
jgi:hypothetical protein